MRMKFRLSSHNKMASDGSNYSERGNDEYFDFLCSVCRCKNKNTEAEKFCTDCSDYYCLTCVKCHDDIPALRAHQIVGKGQFGSRTRQVLPSVPTERCKRHMDKCVDMYCQNHDMEGCLACMTTEHRACGKVLYVPDIVKTNVILGNTKDAEKKLEEVKRSLQDLEKAFIQENGRLIECKKNENKNIQKLRELINERLDELEKETVKELDRQFHVLVDKIDVGIRELQDTMNGVKSTSDNVSSARGNMSQLFVSTKKANEVASNAEKLADSKRREFMITTVNFTSEQKLLSLLYEMKTLGQVSRRRVASSDEYTRFKEKEVLPSKERSVKVLDPRRSSATERFCKAFSLELQMRGIRAIETDCDKFNADTTSTDVAMVICLIYSRLESNIRDVLSMLNEELYKNIFLVILHFGWEKEFRPMYSSKEILCDDLISSLYDIVDIACNRDGEIFKCDINKNAFEIIEKQ